jgi:hypothetical protein
LPGSLAVRLERESPEGCDMSASLRPTRFLVLLPGLLLAAAIGFGIGWWARGVSVQPGLIQGDCRTQFISGVPGHPNPVGPWEPFADLRVVAFDETEKEVGAARSGPDGRYRLALPPGRYTLLAVQTYSRCPPARIGGNDAPDTRGVIDVRPGDTVEVDFDVPTLGK